MSFIETGKNGHTYAPGWFLANNEDVTRLTQQMESDGAYVQTAEDGAKYVPMGAVYPANDGTAVGIVYEDVDVSSGDMPGSVVMSGTVYKNRLTTEIAEEAEAALAEKGFIFVDESEITRPY